MVEFIIKYWVEFLFGVISGFMISKYKTIKNKQEEQERKNKAIENGVQALLRNELIRRYREYEGKGEMSILDKENIEHMFKEYENLGGNGTVKKMYDELLGLPIKIVR